MWRLKALLFIFLVFSFLSFGDFTYAQGIPGISEPLSVSIIPSNPRPNETVLIRIVSFSIDLDRALIVWSLNGKELQSGVGLKELTLSSGDKGSVNFIDISATLIGKGTFEQTVVIRPADVSLVWEADTYTPPFYKGKTLHSFGGSFKVIALPEFIGDDGKKMDSRGLIYTWRKNGEVQGLVSGYGKSTFTTSQTSYLREGEDITVEVSAPNADIVANSSITIIPTIAQPRFYEKNPLYGIVYEKALNTSMNLTNEEITVVAEPFFFSTKNREGKPLKHVWTLNGANLSNFADKSEVTLRQTGGAGQADLRLSIQNLDRILQGSVSNLNIRYE